MTTNTQDPIKLPPLPEPELFTHQTLQPNKDGVMGPSGVHLGVKKRGVCEQAHIDGETDITVYQWFSGEQLEDYARSAIAALQPAAAQPQGDAREAFEAWHNRFYGPQSEFNPIRSLSFLDGFGYVDETAQAQFVAWQAASTQASEPSVGRKRQAFIKGWDERGMAHGLRGTVETDERMRQLLGVFYPRSSDAAPARAVEPLIDEDNTEGTWNSHDSNDTMRHPETSDLSGGATDCVNQPLTRDQVKELMKPDYDTASMQERADFIAGFRAAERAHGITTTPAAKEQS